MQVAIACIVSGLYHWPWRQAYDDAPGHRNQAYPTRSDRFIPALFVLFSLPVSAYGRRPAGHLRARSAPDRRCGSDRSRAGNADGSGSLGSALASPGSRARPRQYRRGDGEDGRRAPNERAAPYRDGAAKIASASPISTIRPRYMTATRRLTCATTPRSCEMKRKDSSHRWMSLGAHVSLKNGSRPKADFMRSECGFVLAAFRPRPRPSRRPR